MPDGWVFITLLVIPISWLYRVVYSIYFGPLRSIPSPLIFQFFPIYYRLLRAKGNAPQVIHDYHLKFGPVFRAGWNLVICVDMEASKAIHSTYHCDRASIYKGYGYFGETILTMLNKESHVRRKRLVAPAFTKARVQAMEPAIVKVGILPLLENIQTAANSGKPLDIYHQLHYMSWDVIGDLVFGESFGMLKSGDDHKLVDWINKVSVWSMVCYMFPILRGVRFPSGENVKSFSKSLLDRFYSKLDASRNHPDLPTPENVLAHFCNSIDKSTGERLTRDQIFSEAVLMLHAGTDTSSNSLTWFFYLIMKYPKVQHKIQLELQEAGLWNCQRIITSQEFNTHLPYLAASLKEAMRLLPAVSGMPLRQVPKNGITILGHHLPEGVECAVPIYSLHRSPELWSHPDEFQPERWLTTDPNPELINFMPFLIGPRACTGKHLAWLKLSIVATNLLTRYQFSLPTPHPTVPMTSTPILRPKLGHLNVDVRNHHHHQSGRANSDLVEH